MNVTAREQIFSSRRRILVSLALLCALGLLCPHPASAITIEWSPVGNAGNANDPATGNLYGGVGYNYSIGKKDVTVSQYVEFLNFKDSNGLNPLGLYNTNMSNTTFGGINFNNLNPAGSMYSVVSGRGEHPVNYVNWYDTVRFANWLNNGGLATSDTESGSYTLGAFDPGGVPINGAAVVRNPSASIVLPSENEWYKAAYYNPGSSSYNLYPTSSNVDPTASGPTALANHANFNNAVGNLTDVGAYTGTTSPYGAFDMAGNVFQLNEAFQFENFTLERSARGAGYSSTNTFQLSSINRQFGTPSIGYVNVGFRVASVPEPASYVLLGLGAMFLFAVARFSRKRKFTQRSRHRLTVSTAHRLRHVATSSNFLSPPILTVLAVVIVTVGGPAGGRLLAAGPVLYYAEINGPAEGVYAVDALNPADSGHLLIPRGSGGLQGPAGLAVDSGGNLYASTTNNVVPEFNSQGTFQKLFIDDLHLSRPQKLAFGPNGDMFVSNRTEFYDVIQRYNGTTGQFISEDRLPPPHLYDVVYYPAVTGMTIGPDHNLYVARTLDTSPSTSYLEVSKFNGTSGAYMNTIVEPSIQSGGATGNLAFGPFGFLYVARSIVAGLGGSEVERISAAGHDLGPVYRSLEIREDPKLAFGPDGRLYLAGEDSSLQSKLVQLSVNSASATVLNSRSLTPPASTATITDIKFAPNTFVDARETAISFSDGNGPIHFVNVQFSLIIGPGVTAGIAVDPTTLVAPHVQLLGAMNLYSDALFAAGPIRLEVPLDRASLPSDIDLRQLRLYHYDDETGLSDVESFYDFENHQLVGMSDSLGTFAVEVPVPEPSSFTLAAVGLAGLIAGARRQRRRSHD